MNEIARIREPGKITNLVMLIGERSPREDCFKNRGSPSKCAPSGEECIFICSRAPIGKGDLFSAKC